MSELNLSDFQKGRKLRRAGFGKEGSRKKKEADQESEIPKEKIGISRKA